MWVLQSPSLCSICTYAQPNWPSPKLVQLDCMSVFNVYRLYHSMGRNVMHCVLCLHHCIVDLHYCGLCSEYRAQAAWVLQKAFHIQSMHQCHLYMCLQFSLYAQIQEIIRTLVTPSNVVNCFDPWVMYYSNYHYCVLHLTNLSVWLMRIPFCIYKLYCMRMHSWLY